MKLDHVYIATAPLQTLSDLEWEALCDHCGRCCLVKLEDDETNEVFYTNMICRKYDLELGRCSCYPTRKQQVPGCVDIRNFPEDIYSQLPETCAYRLRFNEQPLPKWHPLVAGDNSKMDQLMPHIKYRAVSEESIHEEQFEDHIIHDIK